MSFHPLPGSDGNKTPHFRGIKKCAGRDNTSGERCRHWGGSRLGGSKVDAGPVWFDDCSVAKFPIYFLLAYCICIINTVCRYVEIVDIIFVFKPLDGLYFVSIPPLAVKIDFFWVLGDLGPCRDSLTVFAAKVEEFQQGFNGAYLPLNWMMSLTYVNSHTQTYIYIYIHHEYPFMFFVWFE